MRMFARTPPKYSVVGILCCVRDLTFCERRMFLFESVRDTVCKNAVRSKSKNIRQSIFYASFGSGRRSRDKNSITFCSFRLLPLPTSLYLYNYDVIMFRERECVKLLAVSTSKQSKLPVLVNLSIQQSYILCRKAFKLLA